jgi:hypothetical protein
VLVVTEDRVVQQAAELIIGFDYQDLTVTVSGKMVVPADGVEACLSAVKETGSSTMSYRQDSEDNLGDATSLDPEVGNTAQNYRYCRGGKT